MTTNNPFLGKLRTWWFTLSVMVIFAVVTCIGWMVVSTQVMGLTSYTVISDSMLPTLKRGDIVLVDKTKTDYKVGDIITYSLDGSTTTHRVIKIERDEASAAPRYRLKGDNNKIADTTPIKAEEIYGTVTQVLPRFGKPVMWLEKPAENAKSLLIFGGVLAAALIGIVVGPNKKRPAASAAVAPGAAPYPYDPNAPMPAPGAHWPPAPHPQAVNNSLTDIVGGVVPTSAPAPAPSATPTDPARSVE